MFMTAGELHGLPSTEVDPNYVGAWKTHEQMWSDKRKDNVGPWRQSSYGDPETLGESVAKHGVEYPVTLNEHGQIDGGHHRIQAAYDHDPNSYVPVSHIDRSRRQRTAEEAQPVIPRFPSYP
jgi:hypothetical protein